MDENGDPVVIEVNMSYGQIDFHQLCNGPIFGDRTGEMLDYLFKHDRMLNGVGFKDVEDESKLI